MPRGLTFAIGSAILVVSFFAAFGAADVLRDPSRMLNAFVVGFSGLWIMLSPTASLRGTADDDEFLRRVGAMMALVVGLIVAMLYIHDRAVIGALEFLMVGSGFFLTTTYLRTRS